MTNLGSILKKNWFILGLLCSIAIGFTFPSIYHVLDSDGITSYIITLILFLIIGFSLPVESIKNGMSDIKVHLYIQVFIFIVIPVYFLFTSKLFVHVLDGNLVYGLIALAVLPTTISTAIVFTQSSGGNTIISIFNSALSNILGIFISPFLLSLLLSGNSASLSGEEIKKVLIGLLWKMVVPIVIGQFIKLTTKDLFKKAKSKLSTISSVLILCIVLLTFSNVASDQSFISSLNSMVVPFLFLAISHILLLLLAFFGARIFKFSEENQIAVLYVAPQKTMAMGVPLLTVYFASNPSLLGYALLPLLFYHPWQLIVAGVVRGIIHSKKSN